MTLHDPRLSAHLSDLEAARKLSELTEAYCKACAAIIVQREDREEHEGRSYADCVSREADCMADECMGILRGRADAALEQLL